MFTIVLHMVSWLCDKSILLTRRGLALNLNSFQTHEDPMTSGAKCLPPIDATSLPKSLAELALTEEQLASPNPPDAPWQPELRTIFGGFRRWFKRWRPEHPRNSFMGGEMTIDELDVFKVIIWHEERARRTAEVLASLESEVQRMTQAESKLAAENQILREELETLKSGKISRKVKHTEPGEGGSIVATEPTAA